MSDPRSPHRSPLRGLPLLDQTLPALLERQAGAFGTKPLLRIGGVELGFDAVRDHAAAAAAALASAGAGPGVRVVVISSNRLELLQVVLGCAWLGAVAVPLNVALRGAQLDHALANSRPRLIVVEADLVAVLEPAALPDSVERIWVVGGADVGASRGVSVEPAPMIEPMAEIRRPADAVEPGTTLAILYTSGTTGPAKGVCCPNAQFYWWAITMGELLELGEDDVLYTCLPMFHTNALNAFVQALVAGATFVVGERFSASRFWTRAREAGATVTYLLGAMVNMLHAQPVGAGDRAHSVTRALAPATPPALHGAFAERFGVTLLEAYGSTETNATIGAALSRQRPGYMGVVLDDFEIDVVDEHDATVPDGAAGELVLRSRHPFSFATGYFAMPEATVTAWRNLWFHSGDRVVRDPDGWVRFVDRTKDAIRRRGENISSFDVEQAILDHPNVAAVAAFAVPSELAEDEVMVAVVPTPDAQVDPLEIVTHCEERLAYFAIPRYVDVVAELPVTENGKVRKAVLRSRGVTETTWDREAASHRLRR